MRYSRTRDDADEAVQRALEILIRRAPTLRPETAGAWLRTVVKHEAFAVRADRLAGGDGESAGLEQIQARADVEESLCIKERLGLAGEALEAIKPGEAEALLMQAEGHSYKDIARIKGWTYTKVNRLINEGSQAFRSQVASIEAGEACPAIAEALRSGGLDSQQRRHVARCAACRAEVREANCARRLSVVAFPLAAVALRSVRGLRAGAADGATKVFPLYVRVHEIVETASAAKLVAVAASAAAIAGGSAAVMQGSSSSYRTAHGQRKAAGQSAVSPDRSATRRPVDDSEKAPARKADERVADGSQAPADGTTGTEFDPLASVQPASRSTAGSRPRSASRPSTGSEFGP